jgi:hypothetical protein
MLRLPGSSARDDYNAVEVVATALLSSASALLARTRHMVCGAAEMIADQHDGAVVPGDATAPFTTSADVNLDGDRHGFGGPARAQPAPATSAGGRLRAAAAIRITPTGDRRAGFASAALKRLGRGCLEQRPEIDASNRNAK